MIPAMVDPSLALQGRTRETKIRRDDAGRWFEGDDEITHPQLTRAFDAWLIPAPDGSGRWCLSNDINWAYVALQGPPRFVRSVAIEEPVRLRLSDGREVPLDASTLRCGPDDALYCDVPCPGVEGGIVARFDRHAAAQLAELLDEDDDGVYLTLGGRVFRPPRVTRPLGTHSRGEERSGAE